MNLDLKGDKWSEGKKNQQIDFYFIFQLYIYINILFIYYFSSLIIILDMKLTDIQQDIQITGPCAYEANSYP
jgi:hypothetical protein